MPIHKTEKANKLRALYKSLLKVSSEADIKTKFDGTSYFVIPYDLVRDISQALVDTADDIDISTDVYLKSVKERIKLENKLKKEQ